MEEENEVIFLIKLSSIIFKTADEEIWKNCVSSSRMGEGMVLEWLTGFSHLKKGLKLLVS